MSEELEALVAKIEMVFQMQLRLVVMGWGEDDHNPFTRGISGKQVQFLPADRDAPANAGLVLCLDTVGEKEWKRIRSSGRPLHKHQLRRGEVLRVLNACQNFFAPSPGASRACPNSQADEPAAAPAAVPQPTANTKENGMTPEQQDAFKEAFRGKANARGEVNAHVLAKLCKELGIGKAPALVKAGLVQAHKAEGMQKINCYSLVGEDTAPAVTDPTLAEMQRLFNEEPRLRAERAMLDAERAEFEKEIAARKSEFETAFRQKTEVLDRKLALIDGVKKNLTNIKHLLGED